MQSHYHYIARYNMRLGVEMGRIVSLLRTHGIAVVALKGAALAEEAYGNITLRHYGDLDFLIQAKDRRQVWALLQTLSYRPEIEAFQDGWMRDYLFDHLTVMGMVHTSLGLRIEIHWALFSQNYAIGWDEACLWRRQRGITVNGQTIPLLSAEESLLYLCVHGAKHLFERMKWLCDIERFVRAHPGLDWEYIALHAQERGIARMVLLGLYMAARFCALTLPGRVAEMIAKEPALPGLADEIVRYYYGEEVGAPKSFASMRLLWRMRERRGDRLRFLWYAVSRVQLDDIRYLTLPPSLRCCYPIIRLFRLAEKYFFKASTPL